MNFGLLDWTILIVYLVLTVGVGLWVKRYVENLRGYMVADRRVRVALGVATIEATEIGIIHLHVFWRAWLPCRVLVLHHRTAGHVRLYGSR